MTAPVTLQVTRKSIKPIGTDNNKNKITVELTAPVKLRATRWVSATTTIIMVETSTEEEAGLGPEQMEATGIGPTIKVILHPLT